MFSRVVRRLLWGGLLTVSLCALPACQSSGGMQHGMPCGGCGRGYREAAPPPPPQPDAPSGEHESHRP